MSYNNDLGFCNISSLHSLDDKAAGINDEGCKFNLSFNIMPIHAVPGCQENENQMSYNLKNQIKS